MVQWLRLCTSNAGIPGQGTRIPHVCGVAQNKYKKHGIQRVKIMPKVTTGKQWRQNSTHTVQALFKLQSSSLSPKVENPCPDASLVSSLQVCTSPTHWNHSISCPSGNAAVGWEPRSENTQAHCWGEGRGDKRCRVRAGCWRMNSNALLDDTRGDRCSQRE